MGLPSGGLEPEIFNDRGSGLVSGPARREDNQAEVDLASRSLHQNRHIRNILWGGLTARESHSKSTITFLLAPNSAVAMPTRSLSTSPRATQTPALRMRRKLALIVSQSEPNSAAAASSGHSRKYDRAVLVGRFAKITFPGAPRNIGIGRPRS